MAEQQTKKYLKPLPHIDEEMRPWWEALQRHELYIQKCRQCGETRYYPRAQCTQCLSPKTEWVRCSGRGKIYTFTVTHQNQAAGFRESLPYVLAYVELDEGVKLLTNIVECRSEEVKIGMPVEVIYEDATPAVTLAKFRPAR
ncbi:MAG TPA: Zn-ribbon domain-containing OB-fold protein [Candidatus Binataceae bacterium]|nr:Zn-ribbon domain-containing OB-fold protein [Candidatus Binataceae bacterium]